jgi:hypothetical protein
VTRVPDPTTALMVPAHRPAMNTMMLLKSSKVVGAGLL